MKTLAGLKADCVFARRRAEANPSKHLERKYDIAQRAVQAREREVFCEIKEK